MLRALDALLPEVRMRIGTLIYAIRGDPRGRSGRAFEALAVILRNAPEAKQDAVIESLEETSAKYKR